MAPEPYDLVIIGGGLGGSALAAVMAGAGARVLVAERELVFRDRVRGESMHPWGVSEAKALGVYEPLMEHCATEARFWTAHRSGGVRARDLFQTPHAAGELALYHPAMQSQMIRLAAEAGAEVLRGVTAELAQERMSVGIHDGRGEALVQGRLIVGADGRDSRVRKQAGFRVERDAPRLRITGVRLTNIDHLDQEAMHIFSPPSFGQIALLFALRDGHARAYFMTGRRDEHVRLSGARHFPLFVQYCADSGVPQVWFEGVEVDGPLATFEGADSWVEHPYRDGVVLIGDAAAASDPAWGSGLSLTLRDVRVLRDLLLSTDDWQAAADAYAAEHGRYYRSLHAFEDWMTQVMYGLGPEADRIRACALPQLAAGQGPDIVAAGPDRPANENDRRTFLGI